MSQLTHPIVTFRTHRAVTLAALLALAATVLVVLVLAIGGGSSSSSSSTPVGNQSSTPGVRYDGGPEEGSAFAQPPATRYDGGPEEGTAAQSVSGQR
jgi:hypothetical protein